MISIDHPRTAPGPSAEQKTSTSRGLSSRHIQMMAIGGTIGVAPFPGLR